MFKEYRILLLNVDFLQIEVFPSLNNNKILALQNNYETIKFQELNKTEQTYFCLLKSP